MEGNYYVMGKSLFFNEIRMMGLDKEFVLPDGPTTRGEGVRTPF